MEYSLFLDDERHVGDVTWVQYPADVLPWAIVRDYNGFVDAIERMGVPKYISFDHDLADMHYKAMIEDNAAPNIFTKFSKLVSSCGTFKFSANDVVDIIEKPSADYGEEKTGYDCAKWLVEYCANNKVKFPDYKVHSMNYIGGERIKFYIENAKKHLDI